MSGGMVQLGGGIAPHFFELIKGTGIGLHDVDDHVHIIHQYPFGMLKTFLPVWYFAGGFQHFVLNAVGNGFYLCTAAGLANDEKIGYRFVNLSQVQRHHFLAFLVEDAFNNAFEQFGLTGNALHAYARCR